MPNKRNRRRQYKPRKLLNLGENTATAYLIGFEVKLPPQLKRPNSQEYARRESPPTLDEGEARAAYADLLTKADQIGVRNPQLIERTVTDRILLARDLPAPEAPELVSVEAEPADVDEEPPA